MKLPKTLKIGGRTYTVVFPFKFSDTPRPLYGLHDPSAQTIKLASVDEFGATRHRDALTITFLHEILHAVDNTYVGARITAHEKGEEIIDQLAEGIYQVFRDNDLWRLR